MPFFRKEKPDAEGYYVVAEASAVVAAQMVAVKVAGRRLVLSRYGEQIYAFAAECPHAAADLTAGDIGRWKVICPDHGYCFDFRNGRILWPEDENYRLKTFPVKVVDGQVRVKVD